MLTVALGLLAFELAGENAGAVLGTALAIKMIAYVGVAPIASAFAERLPRRAMLVALDLVRAGVALFLPFVTEVWQVYVLIFVLQSASAAFTPTFQATIPDVLPDEKDYTRALSLSRLAYDLESLVSPMLAAALLTVISFHNLFAGTVVGFLVSAALVVSVVLPSPKPTRPARHLRPHDARHPHLSRDAAPARAAGDQHGGRGGRRAGDRQHGRLRAGQSSASARATRRWRSQPSAAARCWSRWSCRGFSTAIPDRTAMLAGASALAVATLVAAAIPSYGWLLPLWFVIGAGYSMAQTPSGRLLRRSSHAEDRPALFAAQFALSHACWLITYPLAGWAGAAFGLPATSVILAVIAASCRGGSRMALARRRSGDRRAFA